MLRRVLLATLPLLIGAAPTPTIRTLDGRTLTPAAIDAEIETQLARHQVTGLDVALIRGGKVVYARSFGFRDSTDKLPLQPDTIIYGASLTKATFAYYVMQLVGEGKLDLDRTIDRYLPKPIGDYPQFSDLAGDERWRRLTLRMLLNHTSGFGNIRWLEPDEKVRFHRDPGTRYGYSGEGLNLAQLVVEQATGTETGAEMQRRLFAPLGMTRTAMAWQEGWEANAAHRYLGDGTYKPIKRRPQAQAIGSMSTTLADWSTFLAAVARGWSLTPRARAELVRPTVTIDSPRQFPTLLDERTDRWQAIKLGYAVGWGTFETPYGHAFFKEGSDEGAENYALCIDKRRDCILLMANDSRGSKTFVPLVEALLGPVNLPAEWEGYPR